MTSQLEIDLTNAAREHLNEITNENITQMTELINAALYGVMDSYVSDKVIDPKYHVACAIAPKTINIKVQCSILDKMFGVRE